MPWNKKVLPYKFRLTSASFCKQCLIRFLLLMECFATLLIVSVPPPTMSSLPGMRWEVIPNFRETHSLTAHVAIASTVPSQKSTPQTPEMEYLFSPDHITAFRVDFLSIAGLCLEKSPSYRYFLLNEFSSIFKYFTVKNSLPFCPIRCFFYKTNACLFFLAFILRVLLMESQVSRKNTRNIQSAQEKPGNINFRVVCYESL